MRQFSNQEKIFTKNLSEQASICYSQLDTGEPPMIKFLLETDAFISKSIILMVLSLPQFKWEKKKKSWMDQIWKASNKEESVGLKIFVQKGSMHVVICTWKWKKKEQVRNLLFYWGNHSVKGNKNLYYKSPCPVSEATFTLNNVGSGWGAVCPPMKQTLP